MEPVELSGEARISGIEVADDAEDEGMRCGDFEKPFVVRKKGTAFDGDAAGNSERAGENFKSRRQCGLV